MYRMHTNSLRQSHRRLDAPRSWLYERIGAQLDFAQFLVSRADAAKRQELVSLIDQARTRIDKSDRTIADLEQAVTEAELLLAPFSSEAKRFEVFCVGHAHIDMNWMWSWPETVSVTIDTVSTVLTLLEEYPEFVFSQSQASIYRILERFRPDLLSRVRDHVKSGRWEVTASHWVETEKNIVNGESLVRHLLYTRQYMALLFDLSPEDVPIDWSPDTFGHAETVPSYLNQGGVSYLYLHRPGAHYEQPVPRAFTWIGPDDSRVLVKNDMHLGYNGVITADIVNQALIPMTEELGIKKTMFVYGVGDHGGGPTRRDIERLIDMQQWPVFPTFLFSKAVDFYRSLERDAASLPERRGELNFEFTGCYTTQTLIKRSNRLAESSLLRAEFASCVATHAIEADSEHIYPEQLDAALLGEAWERTLFSHFHDIIPGSGVRDTRTYAHGQFQEAAAAIGSVDTRALRRIAAMVDTSGADGYVNDPSHETGWRFGAGVGFGAGEVGSSSYEQSSGGGYPFVLFNSSAVTYRRIAEVVIWDPGEGWQDAGTPQTFDVKAPDGTVSAAQFIEEGAYWGHRYVRLAFPATIPAHGYAKYVVTETSNREAATGSTGQTGYTHVCSYATYERGPEGLENDIVHVEFDTSTGTPAQIIDKTTGITVDLRGGGLEYAIEQAGGMSAWRIHRFESKQAPRFVSMERVDRGPHLASLESTFEISQSRFTIRYSLASGDPVLRMTIEGTWFERGDERSGVPTLRLVIPMAPEAPVFTCEQPFGAIDRKLSHGEEVPAYRWVAIRGAYQGGHGACLLYNDTKHGHSYQDGVLALTLIRSSYAPDPLPEIGRHEIRCGLMIQPLAADSPLPVCEIAGEAELFMHQIQAVSTDIHGGPLPSSLSWYTLEPDGGSPVPVISSVKNAEDRDGMIIRLYNPANTEAVGRLELSPLLARSASSDQVTGDPVDLLERPAEAHEALAFDGLATKITVPARGIRSYRIRLSEAG